MELLESIATEAVSVFSNEFTETATYSRDEIAFDFQWGIERADVGVNVWGYAVAAAIGGPYGTMVPPNAGNVSIFRLATSSSTQIVVLELGPTGISRLENVDTVLMSGLPGQVSVAGLVWDGVPDSETKRYELIDSVLSDLIVGLEPLPFATLTLSAVGVDSVGVAGIFDRVSEVSDIGAYIAADGVSATFDVATSQVPGIALGDMLSVRGYDYRVVGLEPDGTGRTVVVLGL